MSCDYYKFLPILFCELKCAYGPKPSQIMTQIFHIPLLHHPIICVNYQHPSSIMILRLAKHSVSTKDTHSLVVNMCTYIVQKPVSGQTSLPGKCGEPPNHLGKVALHIGNLLERQPRQEVDAWQLIYMLPYASC